MAENRICITGLRRSKVPTLRAPLSLLFVVRTTRHVFPFFPLGASLGSSNDRAFSHAIVTFALYLRFSSVRTLKPRCNVLLHSHEQPRRRRRRLLLGSRILSKWLR